MKPRWSALWVVIAGIGLAPPTRGAEFLYFLYNSSLYEYSANASTGALTPIAGSPYTLETASAGPVAADPKGRFLYVAVANTTLPYPRQIFGFRIDPIAGVLTPVPNSPLNTADTPGLMAIDPAGRFVYAAGEFISEYQIDQATGALTLVQQTVPRPYGVGQILVDPGGKFLYALAASVNQGWWGLAGNSSIYQFPIDQNTGNLTAETAPLVMTNGYGASFVIDPKGAFAWLPQSSGPFGGPGMAGFSIDAAGAWTPLTGLPTAEGEARTYADPLGRFVYFANWPHGITTYDVDRSSGMLTQIPGTGTQAYIPWAVPDCLGRFVYGFFSEVLTFAVDPGDGALTQTGPAFPVFDYSISGAAAVCPVLPSGPFSRVTALPADEFTSGFPVQWSGIDSSSTISGYTIYVSDNGGPFSVWLSETPATQGTYSGVSGHTYGFYSIARDTAGNVESAKTTAEAKTFVDAVKPISVVSPLPAIEASPNFLVQWSGSDAGGPGVASYNIYVSDLTIGGGFALWQANLKSTQTWYVGGYLGHR